MNGYDITGKGGQAQGRHVWSGRARILLRWVLFVAAIVVINIAVSRGLTGYSETVLDAGLRTRSLIAIAALLSYALLLAVPFIPGVEIGLSLLIMQGAPVAPYVYVATVAGLSLSFVVGRAFATTLPCSFLRTMGLPRTCSFVEQMKDMDRQGRLALLEDAAPKWVGKGVLKHRYVLIAILINLPGSSIVGGGGAIAMVAGLSRLYSGLGFLATIALATAPVPLAVILFGAGFLR